MVWFAEIGRLIETIDLDYCYQHVKIVSEMCVSEEQKEQVKILVQERMDVFS